MKNNKLTFRSRIRKFTDFLHSEIVHFFASFIQNEPIFRSKMRNFFVSLTQEQQVYLVGIIYFFYVKIFQKLNITIDFSILYWINVFIFIIMSYELIKWLFNSLLNLWEKKIWSKVLFSIIASIIASIITLYYVNIVFPVSKQIINSATNISPVMFSHTINIVSTFLIIPSIIVAILISIIFISVFVCIKLFSIIPTITNINLENILKSVNLEVITYSIRVLFLLMIAVKIYVIVINQDLQGKLKFMASIAQWSAYHLDMYKFTHCKNVKSNERVTYLHRNYIAIAYIDEFGQYHFRVEECKFPTK